MHLHINVTADHIAHGKRGDARYCPIALAIHDLLPHAAISVYTHIFVNSLSCETPRAIRRMIVDYDCTDKMNPVEFEVELESN